MPSVPGYTHHPRPPLRLDRAAQPARLPRRRDQRGDGVRARRRRLLLLRHPRGRLAEPLVQRPHRAARGELRRADRGGAGAAHLRGGRRRTPGRRRARRSTRAGPVLLLTDLYYLDHYGNSAHFPGHAVVLAGYDEEVAQLSDTGFEELQTTRLENLDRARHSSHPAYPLAGHMFTASGEASPASGCARRSRRRSSAPRRRWSSPSSASSPGSTRSRRLAEEAGSWPEVAEDWQWCARFGYQVIERRGTGGGAFRLMYSRFLEEAGRPEAPLAAEAAARWTDARRRLPRRQRERRSRAAPLARGRRRRPARLRGRAAALDLARRRLSGAAMAEGDTILRAARRTRAGAGRRDGRGERRRTRAAGRPGSSGSTG